MKKKNVTLAATGILFFALTACNNNPKQDQNKGQNTTEQTSSPTQKKDDTLSISAGSNGVKIRSQDADINVYKKGANVKTKDIKVKVGDSDKK